MKSLSFSGNWTTGRQSSLSLLTYSTTMLSSDDITGTHPLNIFAKQNTWWITPKLVGKLVRISLPATCYHQFFFLLYFDLHDRICWKGGTAHSLSSNNCPPPPSSPFSQIVGIQGNLFLLALHYNFLSYNYSGISAKEQLVLSSILVISNLHMLAEFFTCIIKLDLIVYIWKHASASISHQKIYQNPYFWHFHW